MPQAPRITQESVERFEVLMDTWKEAIADGEITADEHAMYARLKEDLYQFLLYVDESFGAAVSMLRRGHSAPTAKRQTAHLRVVHRNDGPSAA